MSAGPPSPADRPGFRPVWSARGAIRAALVLLLGVVAGSRLVSAWGGWQAYQEWRGRDPSGADASLTFAEVDLAVAVLGIGGAWLAWWLLRPRGGPPAGTLS
jgi:hypothetical protein